MGATYVECSSKEMLGVHEIFDLAVDTAVGREVQMKERQHTQQPFGGTGAVAGAGREKKSKKRECRIL